MTLTAEYKPQSVSVSIDPQTMGVTLGTPVVKEYVDVETYTGTYEVTPSDETQTLNVEGKRMAHPLVVNPIPSNYGRIDWNGSTLTVS